MPIKFPPKFPENCTTNRREEHHKKQLSKQKKSNVKMVQAERERKPKADIITRDYTIHMSKRLYGVSFKNRAPRAIREIKQFASKAMKTS